jgi:serine/threonine-protein kinase
MATVHVGRLLGPVGFSRTVAIKRLHPQFAKDPEFASMFLDEARLAARIRHPNVVATLDVVAHEGELLLVLDYVAGDTLSRLAPPHAEGGQPVPIGVVSGVMIGVLHGLHAAHEATNEVGEPLEIVHRDVSPQNVIVGIDGVARVLDFGVAKATGRSHHTREGVLKGKIAYMPPEQVKSGAVDRRVDVYAAAVVLWELLGGRRLFDGESDWHLSRAVLAGAHEAPSSVASGVPPEVDAIVMRGLSARPADRFPTALAMAEALERAVAPATPREIGAWVVGVGGEALRQRMGRVADVESGASDAHGVDPEADEVEASGARAPGTRKIAATAVAARPPVVDDEVTRELVTAQRVEPPRAPETSPTVEAPSVAPPASNRAWLVTGVAAAIVAAFVAGRFAIPERAPAEARPDAPPPGSVSARSAESAPTAPAASVEPPRLASATASTAAPPRKAPPRVEKPDCRMPYRIDAEGIKRLRPECL